MRNKETGRKRRHMGKRKKGIKLNEEEKEIQRKM
jgi:hypothetical protein